MTIATRGQSVPVDPSDGSGSGSQVCLSAEILQVIWKKDSKNKYFVSRVFRFGYIVWAFWSCTVERHMFLLLSIPLKTSEC